MADSEYSNLAVAQFTAIQKVHREILLTVHPLLYAMDTHFTFPLK